MKLAISFKANNGDNIHAMVSRRGPRVLLHTFRREVIPVKPANEEILYDYLPVNRIPPLKLNCTAGEFQFIAKTPFNVFD